MSSTTPADSAHDRNQQGGDVRHHVYGWLCRHLRDLYRIQPSALDLSPGDRRGRFSVEASPQRPGDVLVRLAADRPDRRNHPCVGHDRHAGEVDATGHHVRRARRGRLSDRLQCGAVHLRQGDHRAGIPEVALVVGHRRDRAGGGRQLVYPTSWNERVWPGWVWVVPIGAMAVLGYYLTPYF